MTFNSVLIAMVMRFGDVITVQKKCCCHFFIFGDSLFSFQFKSRKHRTNAFLMAIISTFKVADFTYKILSENKVLIGTDECGESANAVSGNTSYSKDVYIPNYVAYKGIKYAVTQVGTLAFHDVKTKNFVIGKNIEILGISAIYSDAVESILFEEGSKCYKIDDCALVPVKNFTFYLPSSLKEINSWGIADASSRNVNILIYYCGSSLIDTEEFGFASQMTIYVTSKYPGKQFMGVSTICDDTITCKFAPEQGKGNRQTSMCKKILSKLGLANSSIISTLFCSV